MASLVVAIPLLAGCSGASDMLSRDTEWFSKPGRLFIKNISIESPPLTPDKPVTQEDLISSDGACPGMAPPGGPDGASPEAEAAPARGGTVALGHTECDVARGIGVPESVNLSNNERGQRLAVLTYTKGPRAGLYTFTAGRLTSIERVAAPAAEPKAKSRNRRAS
jgi:hypothetical protein